MGKCTYVAGAAKCSAANSKCSLYEVSAFVGAAADIGCSLLIDLTGLACQFGIGSTTCQDGDCNGAPATVNSDADCQSYKSICILCILDTSSPCANIICANAPLTLSTDFYC